MNPLGLRKHDVCFLVAVRANMGLQERFDWSKPFVPQVGLAYVRGCEVEGMLDEQGKVIEEGGWSQNGCLKACTLCEVCCVGA